MPQWGFQPSKENVQLEMSAFIEPVSGSIQEIKI